MNELAFERDIRSTEPNETVTAARGSAKDGAKR